MRLGRCRPSQAYLGSGRVLEPDSSGCAEIAAAVGSIGERGDFAHHSPVDDASVQISTDACLSIVAVFEQDCAFFTIFLLR